MSVRALAAYLLVVIVVGVGAELRVQAKADELTERFDDAVAELAQDRYDADIAGCERGNRTVRDPLYTWATTRLVDDALSYDERLALHEIRMRAEPVTCSAVVIRP